MREEERLKLIVVLVQFPQGSIELIADTADGSRKRKIKDCYLYLLRTGGGGGGGDRQLCTTHGVGVELKTVHSLRVPYLFPFQCETFPFFFFFNLPQTLPFWVHPSSTSPIHYLQNPPCPPDPIPLRHFSGCSRTHPRRFTAPPQRPNHAPRDRQGVRGEALSLEL